LKIESAQGKYLQSSGRANTIMNDNVWKGEPLQRMGYLVKLDKTISYFQTVYDNKGQYQNTLNERDMENIEAALVMLKKHKIQLYEELEGEAAENITQ